MTGISISNIAWPAAADDEAIAVTSAHGFQGIDLAPVKVFGPLEHCPKQRLTDYRDRLAGEGLAIPALQGITFGTKHCELFRSTETRANLAKHLRIVAEVANALGAKACVFGAPALRDPRGLPPELAFEIAAAFFTDIAPAFADSGTALAFEAVPRRNQCHFINGTLIAMALVTTVGHPGFRLQVDSGTIFANGEDPAIADKAVPLAAHFHASETDLAPLGSLGSDHASVGAALRRGGYQGWRTAEMRETPDWRANIAAAMRVMRAHYAW